MREVRSKARTKVRGLGGRLTAIAAVGFMLAMGCLHQWGAHLGHGLRGGLEEGARCNRQTRSAAAPAAASTPRWSRSASRPPSSPTPVEDHDRHASSAPTRCSSSVTPILRHHSRASDQPAVWTSVVMGKAGGRTPARQPRRRRHRPRVPRRVEPRRLQADLRRPQVRRRPVGPHRRLLRRQLRTDRRPRRRTSSSRLSSRCRHVVTDNTGRRPVAAPCPSSPPPPRSPTSPPPTWPRLGLLGPPELPHLQERLERRWPSPPTRP